MNHSKTRPSQRRFKGIIPPLKGPVSHETTLEIGQQPQKTISDLFATSKQKAVATLSVSPNKRQKRQQSPQAGRVNDNQGSPLMLDSMYRFNSTNSKASDIVDLTDSPNGSPRDISSAQKRLTNYVPLMGAKKLVVKNFRRTPAVSPDEYCTRIWNQLDVALSAIFKCEKISLEELYRGVENVCRQERAPVLARKLEDRCKEHVSKTLKTSLIRETADHSATDTLIAVTNTWKTWESQLTTIHSIFFYMERAYLLRYRHPSIKDMGYNQFRSILFGDPNLKPQILQGACDIVAEERLMERSYDNSCLRDTINMFQTLLVYTKEFEPKFLGLSQRFFNEWAEIRSTVGSLRRYVGACLELINLETSRCHTFNLELTTEKDLNKQIDKFLIAEKEHKLVTSEEIYDLMDHDDHDVLKQLFTLLQRINLGEKLRPVFEMYINNRGSEIVFDEKRESEMVVRLLSFKKRLDTIWETSFMMHEGLGHSLREAFESFINKTRKSNTAWGTDNPKPGEMIAKHVDMILRGGQRAIPVHLLANKYTAGVTVDDDIDDDELDESTEINKQLDQVLDMFRFVHGKAVFEAFYKKDLARRLLMNRSASADAEKNMIERLKSECGSGFTHNIEQMFKDMELAREESSFYKQLLENQQKSSIVDLNVNVLSAAAWPTYLDVAVEVPVDIQQAVADFEQYYKAKHTGRKLVWKHAMAHCQLNCAFPKGKKEIVVSSFQAIVMLYFNNKSTEKNVDFAELQAATRLSDQELKRTLQSLACAKYRVLVKTPKGRDINVSDTFHVNKAFADPKYRIKINQIQLKETKEENKETHERVAADRHYETQAAIVRVMKSRKKIKHVELVAEVIAATKSRGVLDMADIKKNIEKLIEKEYIDRLQNNTYEYLS